MLSMSQREAPPLGVCGRTPAPIKTTSVTMDMKLYVFILHKRMVSKSSDRNLSQLDTTIQSWTSTTFHHIIFSKCHHLFQKKDQCQLWPPAPWNSGLSTRVCLGISLQRWPLVVAPHQLRQRYSVPWNGKWNVSFQSSELQVGEVICWWLSSSTTVGEPTVKICLFWGILEPRTSIFWSACCDS